MRATSHAICGILLFVIGWQVLAVVLDRSVIVPAPSETLALAVRLVTSGEILEAAWQTAWKVLVALGLAVAIGVPLGMAAGLSPAFHGALRPGIMVMQAVPVVSWLSLVIFAWGVGWRGPVFIAAVALLPMTTLTTVSGVGSLDRDLLEMARLYRVPWPRVLRDVYLGSLLPFLTAILEVGVGQAWKATLVAEYLSGGSGLGVHVLLARMGVDAPRVWAVSLIAVALGLLTEGAIGLVARRLARRWAPV